MIVSHEWLRQFVPHELDAEKAGELLGRHCVTLDNIEYVGQELAPFVVARVLEARRHPNSDKLWLTRVDDGSGEILDVVCGAQNIVEGTMYPFARTGTLMPAGIVIEKRKIRGEVSNGMLCSAHELGLGEDHQGILAIETSARPGTPLLDVLMRGDARLDLDVLPNRPDLLSHRGVARELSAITGVPLRQCPPDDIPGGPAAGEPVSGISKAVGKKASVEIVDADSCPAYVGVVIEGVSVGHSPEWLRRRLENIGQRSISNVVDATNYVLHAFGQPVHAFDLDRLSGNAIVVRPVEEGESLVTLDGTLRSIPVGSAAICDADRPVAIAGIMGGLDTEVTDATMRVLLEVAAFDARFVRSVRKAVGLSTDASYRFERGTDRGALLEVARLAGSLITQVAGGSVTEFLNVGRAPSPHPDVRLRPGRMRKLLGVDIDTNSAKKYLEALGCVVKGESDGALVVTPPSWRLDLSIEVDLIEEVARLAGYDSIPDELRPFRPGSVPDDPLHLRAGAVRAAMVAQGFLETRPMPFTANAGPGATRVRNPLAEDEPFLRSTILDTLGGRVGYNFSRMQGDVRLFELGHVFLPSTEKSPDDDVALPREEMRLGVVMTGHRRPVHFSEPKPPVFDQWDAKALALRMARVAFPGEAVELEIASHDSSLGRVLWHVQVGGNAVGRVVRLGLDVPEWAEPVYGVELTLGVLPSGDVRTSHTQSGERTPSPASVHLRFKALPPTPPAEFDLALVVPDSLTAGQVEAELRRAAGDLLEKLQLFDEFRGGSLGAGVRSLAWRLTLRHPERTLREREIEGRRAKILSELNARLGVHARAT